MIELRYIFIIIILIIILFYIIRFNLLKIDIVYTWVDGSDPNIITKKKKFKINEENVRQFNIDELKYSLRSVNKYMKWINNIYIVVDDDQRLPSWLNINKVKIIRHSDIFDINDLPTFNSHSIESNIYKIKGLSEYYLYMNDDLFITNYTYKSMFIDNFLIMNYFKKGKCIFNLENIKEVNNGYFGAWNKTQNLVNKFTKPSCQWHQIIMLKKGNFVDIKKKYFNEFKNTSSSKFRSNDDIVPNGLAYQYGLYNGDYRLHNHYLNMYIDLNSNIDDILYNVKILENKNITFLCINNSSEYNNKTDIILNFLNNKFNIKSIYEY